MPYAVLTAYRTSPNLPSLLYNSNLSSYVTIEDPKRLLLGHPLDSNFEFLQSGKMGELSTEALLGLNTINSATPDWSSEQVSPVLILNQVEEQGWNVVGMSCDAEGKITKWTLHKKL